MVDTYGRWYPDYPGQQMFQDPAYWRAIGQPIPQNTAQGTQSGQQMMTPPTIRAEIIQTESLEAIDHIPQNAGTTQMYMTKDESNIVIRSMYANGEHSDVVYEKRPPAPPAPKIDPDDFVRKDQIAEFVEEALRSMQKKTAKSAKEDE